MGMFMKVLRMAIAVFSLVLASAVPGSAQTTVFVNGNTSFTVTWQGVKDKATLLATARFTVSNFSPTSFVMTVTDVANTMPTSPDFNARLTAFGFGLMPDATFSNQMPGTIYQWAFANFPGFQRVDVCLTSGMGCAGGATGGLNQGQKSNETYSITITGNFTNGVTIAPIPAKFQTSGGSLETDGVVIDPPPAGASDLTITKTHTPSIAAVPGTVITYTVTVSNVGSSPSSGPVTVTETAPAGLTITAMSGSGWNCTVPTCTRSDALAQGASYLPITVTTTVDASAVPGTVINTAVVSGGNDPNSTNNKAEDKTILAPSVPGMDLTIRKSHSPNTAAPGQTVTYTVTVANVGSSPSSGTVTVTETPPSGLTITALAGDGWTCTVSTQTCTRADPLAPTTSYPLITVTMTVGASVAPGTVTNIAVVSGGGDPNNANNTARDDTNITSPTSGSDLTIAKAHSPSTIVAGQTVTYAVTVTNVGNSPSSGQVTVTETPPAGLTITALSGTGWACIVATKTCLRADALAPNTSYPDITVTASVEPSGTGTITNRVAVSGGGDSNPSNNTATDPAAITSPTTPPTAPAAPDLTVTKSHSGTFVRGQTGVYTVTVSNVGSGPTTGLVTVTEALPTGLTVASVSAPGWTCTPGTRACTRSDPLAPGAAYPPILVTVNIASDTPSPGTNSVTLSGGGDSNSANNTATDPTTIVDPTPPIPPTPVPVLPGPMLVVLTLLLLGVCAASLRRRGVAR
jgi:uncharacterized repeat protein (TIGR01451 family)